MKKRLAICTLAICLLLIGCGSGEVSDPTEPAATDFQIGEPMPGFDAQNQYMRVIAISFQETDGFYCGSNLTGNYIQYYDKASGISGVLCADPACTHDSSDCGAYIESSSSLSCYNGKLYWIARDAQGGNDLYLWRSELSGTNREKVKRISFEDVILPYQPQRYMIHRGKLYMLGQASSVTGTQTGYRVSLLATPLDSSKKYTTLYDETFDRGVQATVRCVGNAAYLSVISFSAGGPFDVTVTRYNVGSGAAETVYEETGMTDIPGAIWVTAQGELYLPGTGTDCAYVWKLENGERVEIASWAGSNPSVPDILDGIAVTIYTENGARSVQITDMSGKTVYDGKLFPAEIPGLTGDPNAYSFALVGGDADKIIVNLQNFTGTGLVDYTIMLDVTDNMKPTILWSSQG